jgi:hypothetical protein
MGIFTAIGANVGKAVAEAAKPAFEIVDKVVTDRDLALKLQTELELAYSDKQFEYKLALAQGNDWQRLIEPIKEFSKVLIILCIFIIFPVLEAASGFHIDIAKYLESMPMIGWIVLVAADLGPTITNKVIDYQMGKKVFKDK